MLRKKIEKKFVDLKILSKNTKSSQIPNYEIKKRIVEIDEINLPF